MTCSKGACSFLESISTKNRQNILDLSTNLFYFSYKYMGETNERPDSDRRDVFAGGVEAQR
jgi:hypothetical protein